MLTNISQNVLKMLSWLILRVFFRLLIALAQKSGRFQKQSTIFGSFYEILGKKLKIKGGGHLVDAYHEQVSQVITKT